MGAVLLPAVKDALGGRASARPRTCRSSPSDFRREAFETVYEVDQSPIGKRRARRRATYIKVFDEIRKLYGQLPVSRNARLFAEPVFVNTEGGRCEMCAGRARSSWR